MAKPPKWKYAPDNSWLRMHYYWINEAGQITGEMVINRGQHIFVFIKLLFCAGLLWWQFSLEGAARWLVLALAIALFLVQAIRVFLILLVESSEAANRRKFEQSIS